MSENRIGSERVRLRLTQSELAKMLGINTSTLSKWENDDSKIPTDTIRKMRCIFGCSTDYLLGIKDERN